MDIGSAVHQRAGLSRYTERLAANLLHSAPDDLLLSAFYNRHSGHQPPSSLQDISVQTIDMGQYAWRLSVLLSQISRVTYMQIDSILDALVQHTGRPIVYHATEHLLPRLNCATVLTVHDLIFEHLPQHHTRLNRLYLQLSMPLFVRDATLIIAVSSQTKHDLVDRYSLSPAKIHVVHEGVDEEFMPSSTEEQLRIRRVYSHDAPYLLMVGSVEPRKNHLAAIQAVELLKRDGYPHKLLIAGGMGWMVEPIVDHAKNSTAADRIIFLDFVPQNDLPALYTAADILLLPSYYEGFGFTALEAMACGTPVICANTGSLPEVVGNAALQVHPDNVAGLTQSIRNVLDQPSLAEEMARLGSANASRFRWSKCAEETVEVYREALDESRSS